MCLPSAPKQAAPPPIPDIPQAPTEVSPGVLAAKRRARSQAASQAGFASTIVTGGRGVTKFAGTAAPTLLGSRDESEAGVSRGDLRVDRSGERATNKAARTEARTDRRTAAAAQRGPGNNLGGIPDDMLAELRRRFANIGAPSVGGGGASNVIGSGIGTLTSGGGASLASGGGGAGGRRGRR